MVSEGPAGSIFWTFSVLKPSRNPAEVEAHADQAGHQHLPDQRARARVRVSMGFAFGGEHRQSDQENGSQWQIGKRFGRLFWHGYRFGRHRFFFTLANSQQNGL